MLGNRRPTLTAKGVAMTNGCDKEGHVPTPKTTQEPKKDKPKDGAKKRVGR